MFSRQKCSVNNVHPFCHTTEHCPACASALQMQQRSAESELSQKQAKKWSNSDVSLLIELLEERACLWNVYDKSYHLKDVRERRNLSSRRFTHFLIFPRFFLGSSSSTASIMLKTTATFLLRSMIVDLKILAADFFSILHPLGALWSVSPRLLKLDSRPQNCALPIAEIMFTGQCSVVLPPPKFFICPHTGHGEQCPVGVQCKCPVVLPGLKEQRSSLVEY